MSLARVPHFSISFNGFGAGEGGDKTLLATLRSDGEFGRRERGVNEVCRQSRATGRVVQVSRPDFAARPVGHASCDDRNKIENSAEKPRRAPIENR